MQTAFEKLTTKVILMIWLFGSIGLSVFVPQHPFFLIFILSYPLHLIYRWKVLTPRYADMLSTRAGAIAVAHGSYHPDFVMIDGSKGRYYLGFDMTQNVLVIIHDLLKIEKVYRVSDVTNWSMTNQLLTIYLSRLECPVVCIYYDTNRFHYLSGRMHQVTNWVK